MSPEDANAAAAAGVLVLLLLAGAVGLLVGRTNPRTPSTKEDDPMPATPTAAEARLHFLTITRDEDGDPVLRFTCRADVDAACHRRPDASGCSCEVFYGEEAERAEEAKERAALDPGEEWDGHTHVYVSHQDCWLQDWFDHHTDWLVYEGPDADDGYDHGIPEDMVQTVPSPISASFDGDQLWWSWLLGVDGQPIRTGPQQPQLDLAPWTAK